MEVPVPCSGNHRECWHRAAFKKILHKEWPASGQHSEVMGCTSVPAEAERRLHWPANEEPLPLLRESCSEGPTGKSLKNSLKCWWVSTHFQMPARPPEHEATLRQYQPNENSLSSSCLGFFLTMYLQSTLPSNFDSDGGWDQLSHPGKEKLHEEELLTRWKLRYRLLYWTRHFLYAWEHVFCF